MGKITESDKEQYTIEELEDLGFQFLHGPDIALDGEFPERKEYSDVILVDRLRTAIQKLNPNIPADAREQALREVQRINSPELLTNNESFHRFLTDGVPVTYRTSFQGVAGVGSEKSDYAWLIDFNNPLNKEFLVVNQYTVIENNQNKRPDILLFVNGIPFVPIELKNPADEKATIKKALAFYADSRGKGDPAESQEKAVEMFIEKLKVVRQLFFEESKTKESILIADPTAYYGNYPGTGFNYKRFFSASPKEKLSIILQAEEHIFGLEDGKNWFINEVTLISKVFALSIPHEKALAVKDEVAFSQAGKARLVKFVSDGTGRSGIDIEMAIKQIIDEALSSDQVVDIFDAAARKKSEISILSLEAAIKKYQNNLLTTAEIIQELIELAREIKTEDRRGAKLGLSEDELAFYDALETNDSAVQVLGDKQLRLIARENIEMFKYAEAGS